MLSAENGGLPGGKVGGMGDVVHDLPRALARKGHRVSVLTPAYGFLARLPGARVIGSVAVAFAGATETCRWLEVPSGVTGVDYYLLDHPRFSPFGHESIYHDDGSGAPFATDATKFAFFSAASAALLCQLERRPDVVHLHDWHLGIFLLMREFDSQLRALKSIRTVFTIHNLALQGIRPVAGSDSSLAQWLPDLKFAPDVVADPRYPKCVNPLAIALRLADSVNTVSPSYAREILLVPDRSHGRHGGEGLEALLAARSEKGTLCGILNGCEYPEESPSGLNWRQLAALISETLQIWIASGSVVDAGAYLAAKRISELPKKRPKVIATSVGRVTDQKLALFRQIVRGSVTGIDRVMAALDDSVLILLGNGDHSYEVFLQQAMVRHTNFLFLKGYSDRLAEALYSSGDLFLMPSSFEPCGISQMLAMRAGQPCVAHAVGGLRDTVTAANGFPFDGATPKQQAQNFAREVAAAVDLKSSAPKKWLELTHAAEAERFSWDASATRYLTEVYGIDGAAN
jgi:starch synthase